MAGADHSEEREWLSDHETRLRNVEQEVIKRVLDMSNHERVCQMRYDAIQKDVEAVRNNMRLLLYVVIVGTMVQLGIASIGDIVRSGAGRLGITITPSTAATRTLP